MPEYLAPGVFVEEVSFRSKSIEGVPTSTTGFAGMVRYADHLIGRLIRALEVARVLARDNPAVRFVFPESGATSWADTMILPKVTGQASPRAGGTEEG